MSDWVVWKIDSILLCSEDVADICVLVYNELKEEWICITSEKLNVVDDGKRRKYAIYSFINIKHFSTRSYNFLNICLSLCIKYLTIRKSTNFKTFHFFFNWLILKKSLYLILKITVVVLDSWVLNDMWNSFFELCCWFCFRIFRINFISIGFDLRYTKFWKN